MAINVYPARREHIPILLHFIHALSVYQHMEDEVTVTPGLLEKWMFEHRMAEALLAASDGKPVGFALFFHMFSAFPGLPGLYLQDLYVNPECRGSGCGKALMAGLARIAVARGCDCVEWACLDWNQPSIDFYRSLGAKPMPDWTNYHLSGDALHALGQRSPNAPEPKYTRVR